MARSLSIANIYSKKFKTIEFSNVWADAFGSPESNGAWLVWGPEKQGKTTFALMLADVLTPANKVLYVSAEEGTGKAFVEACQRAGLDSSNKSLQFVEYTPLEELFERLNKRKSANIVFIDNCTVYREELQGGKLRELLHKYSSKLFVFLAHEERKEPYTSVAKMVRKLAKAIIYVEGLAVTISGRVPGGNLLIDQYKARLYHGENVD